MTTILAEFGKAEFGGSNTLQLWKLLSYARFEGRTHPLRDFVLRDV